MKTPLHEAAPAAALLGDKVRPVAGAWQIVLATLPIGPRLVAWMLTPVRNSVFADELRLFGRVNGARCQAGLEQARDYLAHPRYRDGSWTRRMGLRCRVSLLDAWATATLGNGHGNPM